MAQVASKITGPAFAQLKDLASKVQAKAYGQVEDEDDDATVWVPDLGPRSSSPDLGPRSSSSQQPDPSQLASDTVPTKQKRQLAKQVSLDADGFPTMLTGSMPSMPSMPLIKKRQGFEKGGQPR